MRKGDELVGRLREYRPAEPVPELRERVLAATARVRPVRPPAWSDRLWTSAVLRVAWVSALLALLVFQILSDRMLDRRIEESFGKAEASERRQVAALARDLDLQTIWKYRSTLAAPRSWPVKETASEEVP